MFAMNKPGLTGDIEKAAIAKAKEKGCGFNAAVLELHKTNAYSRKELNAFNYEDTAIRETELQRGLISHYKNSTERQGALSRLRNALNIPMGSSIDAVRGSITFESKNDLIAATFNALMSYYEKNKHSLTELEKVHLLEQITTVMKRIMIDVMEVNDLPRLVNVLRQFVGNVYDPAQAEQCEGNENDGSTIERKYNVLRIQLQNIVLGNAASGHKDADACDVYNEFFNGPRQQPCMNTAPMHLSRHFCKDCGGSHPYTQCTNFRDCWRLAAVPRPGVQIYERADYQSFIRFREQKVRFPNQNNSNNNNNNNNNNNQTQPHFNKTKIPKYPGGGRGGRGDRGRGNKRGRGRGDKK